MANQAITTYKITGTRQAVNHLWSTLQEMEVNSHSVSLSHLAEYYAIQCQTKQIRVNGHIYWAKYDEDLTNDHYLLSFETETAWDACNELVYRMLTIIIAVVVLLQYCACKGTTNLQLLQCAF